jgi:hypothetical protein
LRREIAGLEKELQEAKNEAATAKQAAADAVQAIRALRQQLEPLHKSLKMVFGEISRVDAGGNDNATESASSGLSPKWEMLKQRVGGRQADFIDLLQHGAMTIAQLRAAAHCDIRTAQKVVQAMRVGGLVDKNGKQFSLKQL